MELEDLRVPVQGLRSDQGLMDTDNIRICIDTDFYTRYYSMFLDLACVFILLRFWIGLVLCWVLLAYDVVRFKGILVVIHSLLY